MLIRRNVFFMLASFLILVPSCWDKKVEKMKGLVVINVLDADTHADCHIKGSINIPYDKLKDEAEKKIDKNAEIVTYCSNYMCRASASARQDLLNLGFKKVFVYEGGTAEWKQKGFPVVGICKEDYLNITLEMPEKKLEPYMLSAKQLKTKIDTFRNKK